MAWREEFRRFATVAIRRRLISAVLAVRRRHAVAVGSRPRRWRSSGGLGPRLRLGVRPSLRVENFAAFRPWGDRAAPDRGCISVRAGGGGVVLRPVSQGQRRLRRAGSESGRVGPVAVALWVAGWGSVGGALLAWHRRRPGTCRGCKRRQLSSCEILLRRLHPRQNPGYGLRLPGEESTTDLGGTVGAALGRLTPRARAGGRWRGRIFPRCSWSRCPAGGM